MKPLLESPPPLVDSSFSIEDISLPHFISSWHFHSLTEILLITESTGTGFVGDSIRTFSPGTVALIGEGLPHVWLNDPEYYIGLKDKTAKAIVIKFRNDFLGSTFYSLPETELLNTVFSRASRGVLFYGESRSALENLLIIINDSEGLDRVIILLEILKTIASTQEFNFLASPGYSAPLNIEASEKISKVCEYLMLNFKRNIELDEVAEIAHMTANSFCRFFKKSFLKTFKEFLIEIRIGNACKLLVEREETIYNAAFQSGFNNLSHFHRKFKSLKGITPHEYQRKYQLKNFKVNLLY